MNLFLSLWLLYCKRPVFKEDYHSPGRNFFSIDDLLLAIGASEKGKFHETCFDTKLIQAKQNLTSNSNNDSQLSAKFLNKKIWDKYLEI